MDNQEIKFVFFGGEPLSVPTLEELKVSGLLPGLIVCNPDRPAGRGHKLHQPPVKDWAKQHDIPVYQPETFTAGEMTPLSAVTWDVFVVVAYNKILPLWLIELPTHNTVNVHPSLLPKLRGASPIRTAILQNQPQHIGVSIMQMDAKMDHGPLLAQQRIEIAPEYWPMAGPALDEALALQGGALLAATLPAYVQNEITPREQDHTQATYCGRLTKDMAELHLDPHNLPTGDGAKQAHLTIQAFTGIHEAWFIHEGLRYKITNAHLDGERLVIDRVIPEGKKEQDFTEIFKLTYHS